MATHQTMENTPLGTVATISYEEALKGANLSEKLEAL